MKFNQYLNFLMGLFISFITIIFTDSTFAAKASAEFFASNNTKKIDFQAALGRLKGEPQQTLQNKTIFLLQKEHIEQSQFENILGTYKRTNHQNTADNSEKVTLSVYQSLSPEKVFHIAQTLANILKQESVAVFIPTQKPIIGNIIVKLKSHPYTINEVIQLIDKKLPQYSEAFSLHLHNNICADFNHTSVNEIEWLGTDIKSQEIKKVFPQEIINYHYGYSYLIFRNGQKKQL